MSKKLSIKIRRCLRSYNRHQFETAARKAKTIKLLFEEYQEINELEYE